MKVGDLVVRTYGEGQRPMAIIVGWYRLGTAPAFPEVGKAGDLAQVMWLGSTRIEEIGIKYLETVNENR